MTREEAIQHSIDEIMDNFDVNRCLKVMKCLNWTWRDSPEIPSEAEFRSSLRQILKRAAEYGGASSGGFSFRLIESIDEKTGEPFVCFSGGFEVESVDLFNGISYTKN